MAHREQLCWLYFNWHLVGRVCWMERMARREGKESPDLAGFVAEVRDGHKGPLTRFSKMDAKTFSRTEHLRVRKSFLRLRQREGERFCSVQVACTLRATDVTCALATFPTASPDLENWCLAPRVARHWAPCMLCANAVLRRSAQCCPLRLGSSKSPREVCCLLVEPWELLGRAAQ